MIKNLKLNKTLWLLVACLSLLAAFMGVFNQTVYGKVVSSPWLPGTVAQDAMTLVAGLVLLALGLRARETDRKKQMVVLGLLFYMFYAYGIYVIEQFYNWLYLLYIVIFALSFWSLVYGLLNLDRDVIRTIAVPAPVKRLSVGCLIFIALLFYVLWIGKIFPLMQTGEKIEFAYSITILDMTFVLPSLILSAVLIIKKNPLGLVLAPILFIKAFTLLFSVGLGGLIKPLYQQPVDMGENAFYIILSLIFLALAVLNFWKLRFWEQNTV